MRRILRAVSVCFALGVVTEQAPAAWAQAAASQDTAGSSPLLEQVLYGPSLNGSLWTRASSACSTGEYIAYRRVDDTKHEDMRSVWLYHVPTKRLKQIVAPHARQYVPTFNHACTQVSVTVPDGKETRVGIYDIQTDRLRTLPTGDVGRGWTLKAEGLPWLAGDAAVVYSRSVTPLSDSIASDLVAIDGYPVHIVAFDFASGKEQVIFGAGKHLRDLDVSADGRGVAATYWIGRAHTSTSAGSQSRYDIYVARYDPATRRFSYPAGTAPRVADASSPAVVDSAGYASSAAGAALTWWHVGEQYVTDASGQRLRPSVERFSSLIGIFGWSPDGKMIGYTTVGSAAEGDLFLYDVDRDCLIGATLDSPMSPAHVGDTRAVCQPRVQADMKHRYAGHYTGRYGASYRPPAWSADGRYVYIVPDHVEHFTRSEGATLDRYDRVTGRVRRLRLPDAYAMSDIIADAAHGAVATDRGRVLVEATNRNTLQLVYGWLDEAGRLDVIAELPQAHSHGLRIKAGSHLYYEAVSRTTRANLWAIRLAKGSQPTRISNAVSAAGELPAAALGNISILHYTDAEGKPRPGTLMLPVGCTAARPCPVVAMVYPDALFSTRSRFDFTASVYGVAPFFLEAGVGVYEPDLPFPVQPGNFCDGVRERVLQATAPLWGTPGVDSTRIGLYGSSNGGYTVNCTLLGTRRYYAAVSEAGASDMVSMFLNEPDHVYWYSVGASPWTDLPRYLRNSPAHRAAEVSTPLLLAHGSKDLTVLPAQSAEMYDALRAHGKPTKRYVYEGEDHSSLHRHTGHWMAIRKWFLEASPLASSR